MFIHFLSKVAISYGKTWIIKLTEFNQDKVWLNDYTPGFIRDINTRPYPKFNSSFNYRSQVMDE